MNDHTKKGMTIWNEEGVKKFWKLKDLFWFRNLLSGYYNRNVSERNGKFVDLEKCQINQQTLNHTGKAFL
ncbi:hypothetical protein [Peribacillus butanolivorans]|uniref:hypothetical protein n=1 Tax=Peribacillus butanolivorans TaxID=421767 RepID=UPI0038130AB8